MAEENQEPNEAKLDFALLSFLKRHDRGELVDREAFLREHPDMADQLRALLDAADWIEKMAGPTWADSTAPAARPGKGTTNSETYDPNAVTVDLRPAAPSDPSVQAFPSTAPPNATDDAERRFAELPAMDNSQANLPCRFGDYVLEKVLGRGGMGVVYLANQTKLNRRVAIKMIRSGALASQDEVSRFYSEARSVAKLDHANIVTVYHCGEQAGHHFFSMDYIPGTDLAKRLAEGPMDPKEAVRYVRDVARAIDYAHSFGVVHRDLKPANVLIDVDDEVVLTDFGLAKQMGGEQGLTATGAALGTPSFMSPEQASGKSEDQGVATDVYAIGAILFALLTGKPPFQGDTVMQTLMQVIHRPAPSTKLYRNDIHGDLETIITKCLEKTPSLRYASARELAEDLDRFYHGHPIVARPPSLPRRFRFWLATIPLVAAVTGTRPVEPTRSQRWAQNLFMLTILLLSLGILFGGNAWRWMQDARLPSRITIASGAPGGMYFDVAGKLSDRMLTGKRTRPSVLSTGGSLENARQLLDGHADVALMQESTIRADQVAVVAPLFFEAIHILVPNDSEIQRIEDLAGQKIVMGSKDSGTRQAALKLFRHFQLTDKDFEIIEGDWTQIEVRAPDHVLVAVVRAEQSGMADLLGQRKYRLLSLDHAAHILRTEPMFRLFEFDQGAYRGIVTEPITTLSTTALLVVRRDASARLVQECLEAIYQEPSLVDGLIPRDMAAGWQGLPYHPTARAFFNAVHLDIGTPTTPP